MVYLRFNTPSMQHFKNTRTFFILLIIAVASFGLKSSSADQTRKKEYVIIDSTHIPRSQKEALIVLPGFGAQMQGVKDIAEYFSHKGYDFFMPDYIDNDSIDRCVANFDAFYKKNKLSEYRKVHVFTFIIGSWALNRWMVENDSSNIATVIYDRSPLQERVPYALEKDFPLLIRLVPNGDVIREFAHTPYEPVVNDEKNIGIILESTASKLVRKHKKTILSLGEPDWSIASRKQDCDDYFYTTNNHDDMYHDFSVTGTEILYFIKNGKFSTSVPRTKPDVDPYAKK